MKKLFCLILVCVLILATFAGCNNANTEQSNYSDEVIVEEIIVNDNNNVSSNDNSSDASNQNEVTDSSQGDTTAPSNTSSDCTHRYDEKIVQTAELFKAGIKKYTCADCGDSYDKTYPVKKLKILSLGNSYSLNSIWELYTLCKQAGVNEVDIAIMYIGGCSLDQHWENIQKNNAAYELYRNNNGSWITTKNCSIETIISEGGWDVITLQNSSGMSGRSDGFTNLDNMASYVSGKCPDAKIVWHMTWGYQTGSKWLTHDVYNGDEMLMYNSIVDRVKDTIIPSGKFDLVVPVGTAVMNARTSRIKNDIHQDDGSHLSEDAGYYVGALTWYRCLTGQSLYDVNFIMLNPTVNQNMNIFIESAENAFKNPYQITQSSYTN